MESSQEILKSTAYVRTAEDMINTGLNLYTDCKWNAGMSLWHHGNYREAELLKTYKKSFL